MLVVLLPPPPEFPLRVFHRPKPAHIQTFIPQTTIEAFNEAIFNWPSRSDEVQLNTVLHGPSLQNPSGELAAVINGYALGRGFPLPHCLAKSGGDLGAVHGTIGLKRDALPRELIDHGKNTDAAAVGELIAD